MKKNLLLLVLAIATMTAQALDFTSGKYAYSTDGMPSGTVACKGVASGQTTSASILIPGTVQYNGVSYRVKEISANAFKNNTTATILKVAWGVETIGDNAFYGSKLKYVYLPSSVSLVGNNSFYCSDLVRFCIATNKEMPSVNGVPFMTSNLPEIVRNQVLWSRYGPSNDAVWKTFSNNNTITENGRLAFDFENNSQYYVVTTDVRDTGTKYAMLVGAHNQKTSIELKNSMSNTTNSEYGGNGNFSCYLKFIADEAFKDNTTITSVGTANDQTPNLEIIGYSCFRNCTSLKTLYTNAKTIYYSAFQDCSSLDEISLINNSGADYGVKEIGTCAFYGTAITTLNIPSTLSSIARGAFGHCTKLKTITKSSLNTNYDVYDEKLFDTRNGYLVLVPAARESTSMIWPTYAKGIGDYAFDSNANLTSLYVPYGITHIGYYAFADMEKCTEITIPSSVVDFDQYALQRMRKLQHLYFNSDTIPKALDGTIYVQGLYVPFPVFENINSGVKLYVPLGCRDNFVSNDTWNNAFAFIIDGEAYDIGFGDGLLYTVTSTEPYTDTNVSSTPTAGQAKLVYSSYYTNTGITLPSMVSSLGKYYIVTSIDRHAFDGNIAVHRISGGAGVKTIPAQTFKGSYLTSCQLPHLVTIGEQAFYNSSDLSTFIWGDCLETIGDYAFCSTALNSEAVLPATVHDIGMRAFYNCSSLPGLFISNPSGGTISTQFFGNNASGFKCYVPLQAFYRFSNFATWTSNGAIAYTQMHPYIKPETEWSLISCHKPLTLPNSVEFYIANGYDSSKKMITTEQVTGNIAAYNGLLVKANPGTVYRLTTASNGNIYNNLLRGASEPNTMVETTTGNASNYDFNTETREFDLIATYRYYQPGQAWLKVPYTNASTIQIDQLYVETVVPGDVDGDGTVTSADITVLYNYLLNGDESGIVNGDQDSDGTITSADITSIYNILLGN